MRHWTCGRVALLVLLLSVAVAQPPADGTPAPQEEYVFIRDTDRVVAIKRGADLLIGKLDAAGNFLQERIRPGRAFSPSSAPPPVLNVAFGKPAPAYEYRSGRLIEGEINTDDNFVPAVGSKVIRFEDYKYRPGGPRIWNLPGYFKKKERPADKQGEKK